MAEFNSLHPDQKYLITLNEPRVIDSFHPIKTVQNLLDSLNSPVKFLSKK